MAGGNAIIGGSGLQELPGFQLLECLPPETPWGLASAPILRGVLDGTELFFLPRRSAGHSAASRQLSRQYRRRGRRRGHHAGRHRGGAGGCRAQGSASAGRRHRCERLT